jgi:hypothetical protein
MFSQSVFRFSIISNTSTYQLWFKGTLTLLLALHPPCPPLILPSRRYEALLVEMRLGASGITPPNSRCSEGALLGGVPPPSSVPQISGREKIQPRARCQFQPWSVFSTNFASRSQLGILDFPNFQNQIIAFFVIMGGVFVWVKPVKEGVSQPDRNQSLVMLHLQEFLVLCLQDLLQLF